VRYNTGMLQIKTFTLDQTAEINKFMLEFIPENISYREQYVVIMYDDKQPVTDLQRANSLRIQIAGAEEKLQEYQVNYRVTDKEIATMSKQPEALLAAHETNRKAVKSQEKIIAAMQAYLEELTNEVTVD
jgi:hypothetical protein